MARDPEQAEAAATRAEAWLDQLDPAVLASPEADASDLRAIAAAKDALDATVRLSLAKGRTWSPIAMALNGTRSDAQARFGDLTPEVLAAQKQRVESFLAEHSSDEQVPEIDEQAAGQALAEMHANSADLYVHVEEAPIVRTDDLGRGVQIDYDEHGGVVGVELLDVERLTVEGETRWLSRSPKAGQLSDDDLDAVDVDSAFANANLDSPVADAGDLRAVTAAIEARRTAGREVHNAVAAARRRGRSWSRIAGLFGPA